MAKEKTASNSRATRARTVANESTKKSVVKKTTVKDSGAKHEKKSAGKKKSGMSLYSNLAYKRRVIEDERARKKAEELAKLPKNPVLRFFARLRPDRVLKAIFSREGFFFFLKFVAFCVLMAIIGVGGLFLYFKKDLAAINPEELAKRVTNTVNVYLDRNGEVLWEDKGSGDYRLVVSGDEISTYMRQATVAIEDKSFYTHIGIDPKGIARAVYVTLSGGAVQGGSTLTQQLIKQVYFSDEANDRTMSGIPRKIKEMILAIEIEKMYTKEEIITLYLNESPFGGRRNGVESAAQTYFKKSAKDLNLEESALLAAIPNNPGVLNPYNEEGHEALIARQHKVLDSMAEMGYITAKQAKKAKKVDILAQIQPETELYENIKAPWFVLEVQKQLEAKYGIKTMRAGGFIITTTLDMRLQNIAENAIAAGRSVQYLNGSDNAGLVSVDVETAQVVAMVGSSGWDIPGYGQVNVTTSLLEPASSIKPVLDFAPLFMQRQGINYGPGTIWPDVNIDSIYCKGSFGACKLRNYDGRFYGNITIRRSLAGSLNIGAVKALYVNGIDRSLDVLHRMGDKSYCAYGEYAGLSMAIGGGCSVRPVEHANTYATLARGGVYKELTYWLEVKNSNGDIIESWKDNEGERVLDEQTAYMVTSILSDPGARVFTFGNYLAYHRGFWDRTGRVWFASKTGTTDNGMGQAKDSWSLTYSPVLATAIWSGNHDGRGLRTDVHDVVFEISQNWIYDAHNIYEQDGKWWPGMSIAQPAGMKRQNGDIWPSWYNSKNSTSISEKKTFDTVTKKLASDCTPQETRIEVEVSKIIDPVLGKDTYVVEGYNPNETDTLHMCDDTRPTATVAVTQRRQGGEIVYDVTASASYGTYNLVSYELIIDGEVVSSGSFSDTRGDTIVKRGLTTEPKSVTFKVRDEAGYMATATD